MLNFVDCCALEELAIRLVSMSEVETTALMDSCYGNMSKIACTMVGMSSLISDCQAILRYRLNTDPALVVSCVVCLLCIVPFLVELQKYIFASYVIHLVHLPIAQISKICVAVNIICVPTYAHVLEILDNRHMHYSITYD